MSNPAYEFTAEQNFTFRHLASRMRIVGGVLMAMGALLAVAAIVAMPRSGSVVALELAIILGLVGWWSLRAGAAFSRIATTEGADISHLMKAVTEIRKLYELEFWVLIVLLFVLVFTLLAVSVGPARLLFLTA